MAYEKVKMSLVLVLVTMLWAGASAQSSCTNVIISMSPCLNYITGNTSTPSSGCCTQLASVVRSQPQCLCEALNGGGSSLGININKTRALALPGDCDVQTPPLSRCNAGSPADSPAGTPGSSGTKCPSLLNSPLVKRFAFNIVGSGSKTVPSTVPSAASSIELSISYLFFLLCVATFASSFTTY